MQLTVIDGSEHASRHQANLISYVIDEQIAFDAGALGLMPLAQQRKLTTLFLSHSHADHIATLPLLISNIYASAPNCITVYANVSTIADLKSHVFNDRIWPDVFRLSETAPPFLNLLPIEHAQCVAVGNKRITAFEVKHTIPTLGYVVEDENAAIALVADTAPCEAIWSFLNQIEKLRAVFLEISFPNSMQWLAELSQHLTPRDFLAETCKLRTEVAWYVTHMKPEFAPLIVDEVALLQLERCQFAVGSQNYAF